MSTLILIRHGQTLWTKQKKYQGHTDLRLSAKGRQSTRSLSKRLEKIGMDFLYTSPLKRARESCAILNRRIRLKPRMDSRLKEINFGVWEGKSAKELITAKEPAYLSWMKGKWKTPPRGESLSSFRRRVRNFLKECLKQHTDQKVGIVCHGGTIRMIALEVLGLPMEHFFSFRMKPGSFLILESNKILAR